MGINDRGADGAQKKMKYPIKIEKERGNTDRKNEEI